MYDKFKGDIFSLCNCSKFKYALSFLNMEKGHKISQTAGHVSL